MTMQARNPDFAQRVHESFALQGAMHTLGASLEAIAPGRVVIVMAHRPELTQQHGFVHAGMVATGLDSACGFAAFGDETKLIATMTATMMTVVGRDDVRHQKTSKETRHEKSARPQFPAR